MKITQGQYFEIQQFFIEKCRLVEEKFFQEMMDHFVDGIESQMAEGISFEKAMNQVVDNFGGVSSIRKMEWSFQKSFMKKQVKELWMIVGEYSSRPKLYRSIVIFIVVTILIIWIEPGKANLSGSIIRQLLPSLLFPLIATGMTMGIQRYLGWFRSSALVGAQDIVNVLFRSIVITVSVLLFLLITKSFNSLITREILCSLLGSMSTILILATLDYSHKRKERKWYQTKLS